MNLHEPNLLKTLALHAHFFKNLSEREGPAQVGRAAGREGRASSRLPPEQGGRDSSWDQDLSQAHPVIPSTTCSF